MVEYCVKSLALYDMCNHLWFYNAKFRCFLDVLLAKKYSATFHSLNKHRISLDELVSVIVFKINDPPAPTHTQNNSFYLLRYFCIIWGFGVLPFFLYREVLAPPPQRSFTEVCYLDFINSSIHFNFSNSGV